MPQLFHARPLPAPLYLPENAPLLTGVLRGIEKEGLRVTAAGELSQAPHPQALGAALTHPFITTDFSEALLELITAPTHSLRALTEQLASIHAFSLRRLGGEILWGASMPCQLPAEAEIPVALYGKSNRARMKTIYREGLSHRYGRVMQTVAGVHYNFSFPAALWALLQQQEGATDALQSYISRRYFDLIRNFRRHYWLLIYLFGASPAADESFVAGRPHRLERLGGSTVFAPYATSLRMGDLGYQSHAQAELYVDYNSKEGYVRSLIDAINRPYPAYEALGVAVNGAYRQLNTGLLQIENEFYSAIRPKRTAHAGETALTALCNRGVEYIEVRCLDVDPFAPIGVTEEQLRFLDCFLLFCLLEPSPPSDAAELARITANQRRVVMEGRTPGLELESAQGWLPLTAWGDALMDALTPIAELLDTATGGGQPFSLALAVQRRKLEDPALTPSARVLAELGERGLNYASWVQALSSSHKKALMELAIEPGFAARLDALTPQSLAERDAEDARPQMPFDAYLERYYQQYQVCYQSRWP